MITISFLNTGFRPVDVALDIRVWTSCQNQKQYENYQNRSWICWDCKAADHTGRLCFWFLSAGLSFERT